jgi:hypothetical protein
MTIALLGLGLLGAPAFAAEPARPGTVNYLEGAAYLDGQPVNSKDVGSIGLEAGQELRTTTGKAEILLTPGVFLRLDSNTTVKMVSPDLTLTQVEVEKGRAGVEVDEIHEQNNIQIVDAGVATRLQKVGYYEFSADKPTAFVFKGEASVEVGDNKTRELKQNHELLLAGPSLATEKPAGFDSHGTGDDLYNWSSLRSHYLAEANNQMAGEYVGSGYYPGWYWNPYLYGYTFIGGGPFYSPFGWGFYPIGWGGYYGGYYGGRYLGRGGYYGGGYGGGFRGGMAGGFHGGGGGRR